MPRKRTPAPASTPAPDAETTPEAPAETPPRARKARPRAAAPTPPPPPAPREIPGVGVVPAGVSEFSIHRQNADGREIERVAFNDPKSGMVVNSFSIDKLDLENLRGVLGPGRFVLRWTGTDPVTGKRKGMGGSKAIVFMPKPDEAPAQAAAEPSFKVPAGFEQMTAMMSFFDQFSARSDQRLRSEFERSQQRDREFFAMMFRGEQERHQQTIELLRASAPAPRAAAAPAGGGFTKADVDLAALRARVELMGEGGGGDDFDDEPFDDDEPAPASATDQLVNMLISNAPNIIEKGVAAFMNARAHAAATPAAPVIAQNPSPPQPAPAPVRPIRPIAASMQPQAGPGDTGEGEGDDEDEDDEWDDEDEEDDELDDTGEQVATG